MILYRDEKGEQNVSGIILISDRSTCFEFQHTRPKLTSRERRKINSRTHLYLFMKASRVVLRGVRLHEESR